MLGLPGECLAVSGSTGGVNRERDARVWIGGGSSSQKLGCVTSLDLETGKSLRQVPNVQ